jgi:hypothetical protein
MRAPELERTVVSSKASPGSSRGAAAGGEDDGAGLDAAFAIDDDFRGRGKAAFALDIVDGVLLEEELHALGQLVGGEAAFLERLGEVEAGDLHGHAQFAQVWDAVEEIGLVDEGFAGDAAQVQADAAGLVLLDDAGLESELGGADGRDIAAGAGAENHEIISSGVHAGVPSRAGRGRVLRRAP